PLSLAPKYSGKTCIGNLIHGEKDGKDKDIFIYNICNHAACYKELESQAICYTAGVPPVAVAMLIAQGTWDVKTMANVEELDPDPFIKLLDTLGLETKISEVPATFESVHLLS
ncbi:MAG: saccharopine dehydrogenase, partial [Candidatus Omnitrophica bacterium]|nr:saccharopine dehydrogenase [Candidatus Omnitrophota bacterium]